MALDYSDIAGHRGEHLGEGTTYFRDHFLGRDSAVTTGLYNTGGSTKAELVARATEAVAGAEATWDTLPRISSRVSALGNGKAERVTRYGTPRFGAINRFDKSYRIRSRTTEKPWLLVKSQGTQQNATHGYPVTSSSGATLLAHNRTSSGHFLPIMRVLETIVDLEFTIKETKPGAALISFGGAMINKVNNANYVIDVGGQGVSGHSLTFVTQTLRFNYANLFTRQENGVVKFYNVYSFTYSPFAWRYQYIPPLGNDAQGEPIVPTVTEVVTGRLYNEAAFAAIPTG